MVTLSKFKVTTEDLVRDEIEKLRIRMDSKFYDVDEQLLELKDGIMGTDNKLDRVLTQLDSIAGQFKKFDEERILMSDILQVHTDQIEELQNVVLVA